MLDPLNSSYRQWWPAVGTRNGTWVLCMGSKCSEPLILLVLQVSNFEKNFLCMKTQLRFVHTMCLYGLKFSYLFLIISFSVFC